MKITQNDLVHMGVGRTDNVTMSALEFKNIRKSLGFTMQGMGQFLGCDKNLIKAYENETGRNGTEILDEHAKLIRKIAAMPTNLRDVYVKSTGCQLLSDTRYV